MATSRKRSVKQGGVGRPAGAGPGKPAPSVEIDAYIGAFPKPVQARLTRVRQLIRGAAPRAQEKMAYGIPTFTLHGNLVHFAAFKAHLGLYPGPAAIVAFARELEGLHTSKGAIQFPHEEPLPTALMTRLVKYCVRASEARAG